MLTKVPALAEKQDPRVKRTRQLIVDAFGELLKEKSFDGMTVQDIADRATVNRATFYAHFEDKYKLLDHLTNESFNQVLVSKLPPNAELNASNLQLLIQIVCEYLEWLSVHCKPSFRSQFDSQLEQQIKRRLYQLLLDWHKKAAKKPIALNDYAELGATATTWAIYGLAVRWSQGDRQEPAATFARRVLPLISAVLELPTEKSAARRQMN